MRARLLFHLVFALLLCQLWNPTRTDAVENGPLPTFEPRSNEPIDLTYTEKTSVQGIYRALGKSFGFDIVFDPKLRDSDATLELENATAQQALDRLMAQTGHFYVVIDPHTILIADDTPQNRRSYEPLTLQIIHLDNVDVRDAMTVVRSLLGTKNLAPLENASALVVRDSVERSALTAELVRVIDKPRAEVEIGVELLEIDDRKLEGFLTDLAKLRGEPIAGAAGLRLAPEELAELHSKTRPQSLARPSVSVLDREKGRLKLTELVVLEPRPAPAGEGVGGAAAQPLRRDEVGVELWLETQAHPAAGEVSLEVQLQIRSPAGRAITARELASSQRLRSGDTYLVAGLSESSATSGVGEPAGLSRLSRLLARTEETKNTELVIALTPRIVRGPGFTAEDLQPLLVGTESSITFSRPAADSAAEPATPSAIEDDREKVRQRLRERLKTLPNFQGGEEAESAPEGDSPGGG